MTTPTNLNLTKNYFTTTDLTQIFSTTAPALRMRLFRKQFLPETRRTQTGSEWVYKKLLPHLIETDKITHADLPLKRIVETRKALGLPPLKFQLSSFTQTTSEHTITYRALPDPAYSPGEAPVVVIHEPFRGKSYTRTPSHGMQSGNPNEYHVYPNMYDLHSFYYDTTDGKRHDSLTYTCKVERPTYEGRFGNQGGMYDCDLHVVAELLGQPVIYIEPNVSCKPFVFTRKGVVEHAGYAMMTSDPGMLEILKSDVDRLKQEGLLGLEVEEFIDLSIRAALSGARSSDEISPDLKPSITEDPTAIYTADSPIHLYRPYSVSPVQYGQDEKERLQELLVRSHEIKVGNPYVRGVLTTLYRLLGSAPVLGLNSGPLPVANPSVGLENFLLRCVREDVPSMVHQMLSRNCVVRESSEFLTHPDFPLIQGVLSPDGVDIEVAAGEDFWKSVKPIAFDFTNHYVPFMQVDDGTWLPLPLDIVDHQQLYAMRCAYAFAKGLGIDEGAARSCLNELGAELGLSPSEPVFASRGCFVFSVDEFVDFVESLA